MGGESSTYGGKGRCRQGLAGKTEGMMPLGRPRCRWEDNIKMDLQEVGGAHGIAVKALRYKPAGRGFDSRWCHWNFSVTQSFRSHYGPGVDSASNRNEYQVYSLRVKAAGA